MKLAPNPANTTVLIDGSSYLYRAFHAMPDLRNAAGEPTGAIYGFINMLKRMEADTAGVAARICVFDAKGKTFRDDLYPEYKANRPSMPSDLAAQIEPIHAATQALGWQLLSISGVEADDVIGTLCVQLAAKGQEVVVSTGDKDLAQLVNDKVRLINTMNNELLDEAGVLEKFGVKPAQMIDYLTLMGDTVDNVPGVPKCGQKTAVKWLAEFGSLDNLVANAASVKGAVGENLRQALPQLPLSKALVTIKCDVELPNVLAQAAPSIDNESLKTLYNRFGFRTWLRELAGEAAIPSGDARAASPAQTTLDIPKPPAPVASNYTTILTQAALDELITTLNASSLIALDTETTALDKFAARLVGISVCWTAGSAAYIPLAHRYPGAPEQLELSSVLAQLKPWLENPSAAKVLQHAKFDMHVFANHGIALQGIAADTLLAAYTLESHQKNDLNSLAQRWLGRTGVDYEALCGKGAKQIGFDEVELSQAAHYAAEDADFTYQIWAAMQPVLAQDEGVQTIYALELAAQPVIFTIERNGVLIDKAALQAQSHALGQTILTLENDAYALAGQPFNLGSPKQLGEILFTKLGLPVTKKTATGAASTDEEVLTELAQNYPLPKLLLEHRGLAKLKNTYTDKLPVSIEASTGRVHTHYAQAAVVTGRLASSDPNLQNIPVKTEQGRRVREAFIARPDWQIVSADYSQIELRIMAHLSQDEALLKAFTSGIDVHRATASEVFGVTPEAVSSEQRRYAKVINFGLIYGMSAYGLANNLGIDNNAAKNYINRYFERYPGVKNYMESTKLQAKAQGFVRTVFGRKLMLPEINSANGMRRSGAERAAINAPMQGTAADLIKLAMVDIQNWLTASGKQTLMIMQVHDELVFEVPASELDEMRHEIPARMAAVASLSVPLLAEVGVGANWEAAH